MPKNRTFHAKKNYIDKKMPQILPQVYAALAIALWHNLDGNEEEKEEAIEDIFADSQEIWQECVESGEDMLERCKGETGIDLRVS